MKKFTLMVLGTALLLGACTHQTETQLSPNIIEEQESEALMPTELVIEDIVVGEGDEASSGAKVTVHYTGTLEDGTKFDSSHDRNQPFSFNLGAGEVIQGWDQGVLGMKIGGKRKLIIPPGLAYGPRQIGIIPSNSTLFFEIELLEVGQ